MGHHPGPLHVTFNRYRGGTYKSLHFLSFSPDDPKARVMGTGTWVLGSRRIAGHMPLSSRASHIATLAGTSSQVVDLGSNDKTCHGGRRQGREHAGNEGRNSQARDISTTRRSQLSKNTDLNSQGADVAETTASVGGNQTRTVSELTSLAEGLELTESDVLVLKRKVSSGISLGGPEGIW
jgi:hypothetical protein